MVTIYYNIYNILILRILMCILSLDFYNTKAIVECMSACPLPVHSVLALTHVGWLGTMEEVLSKTWVRKAQYSQLWYCPLFIRWSLSRCVPCLRLPARDNGEHNRARGTADTWNSTDVSQGVSASDGQRGHNSDKTAGIWQRICAWVINLETFPIEMTSEVPREVFYLFSQQKTW